MDNITLQLNSPITEDQWDAITDVDFENTEEILFTTKHKKNVRFVKAQQWIPCSERLPEKLGDYLVSVKRHGWNCEEHIENDIAYWDDLEGFHKVDEVLAWMPLPDCYQGENAND